MPQITAEAGAWTSTGQPRWLSARAPSVPDDLQFRSAMAGVVGLVNQHYIPRAGCEEVAATVAAPREVT